MKAACLSLAGLMALAGCAQPPMGPQVQVLPGPNKPFNSFQADGGYCRGYASQQVAGQAEVANNRAVGGAVLTTVLGAGLGAVFGGGRGAAVGASVGAGLGTVANAAESGNSQGGIQAQYDNAYAACMVAQGNRLPQTYGYAAPVAVPVYPWPYNPNPHYGY